MSKLPKLSQTPQPADNGAPMPEPGNVPAPGQTAMGCRGGDAAAPVSGGEVWFAAIIGLVFIFLSRSFPAWLICKFTGKVFATGVIWSSGPKAGQPADYWELVGHTALSDMAVFLFGVAVLIEAVMYFVWLQQSRELKAIIWAALVVTVLATALNLLTALVLFSAGITPLISLLAVAFGGWMFVQQRALLAWTREQQMVRGGIPDSPAR